MIEEKQKPKTKNQNPTYTIGLISDTHGLLRPEAVSALRGVSLILHSGDIGEKDILNELEKIAPVIAVRGNMDRSSWSRAIPETDIIEKNGLCFYLLHDLDRLDLNPGAARIDVVVSGHTHKPHLQSIDGVLYINPGSAGHRRYDYPVTIGLVSINNTGIKPEIVYLDVK